MESTSSTDALSALGHSGRLAVFRLLARRAPQGVRPGEIAGALGLKPNTLSVHLSNLARAGLVTSERRGKSVFYHIALDRAAELIDYLVSDCCRGRPELCTPLAARALAPLAGDPAMPERPFNVLFVCTGNSARSIFAEAILNREGAGRFNAFSAGTRPFSELNPHAVAVLEDLGHDVSGLRAKNVTEFRGEDAPKMDFVFTVCDQAANEDCPPWPGQPVSAHWGVPDPVKVEGTEAEKGLAFLQAYRALHRRLSAFMALPLDSLDRISLQGRLDAIDGQADAAERAG
ncbi:MAG: metalloregulator ArsR/SmtB family transcription factor [Pseudomonadota bacterium]